MELQGAEQLEENLDFRRQAVQVAVWAAGKMARPRAAFSGVLGTVRHPGVATAQDHNASGGTPLSRNFKGLHKTI